MNISLLRFRKMAPVALLFLFLGGPLPLAAYGLSLPANGVANLTTREVGVVPEGVQFMLHSVVVNNRNDDPSCCARVYKNGSPITGFVGVPANTSFQVDFAAPVPFSPGDSLAVRNGAAAGPLHFTVMGDVQPAP